MLPSLDGRPLLDANHQGPIILVFIPTLLCSSGILVVATIVVRLRNGVNLSLQWSNPVGECRGEWVALDLQDRRTSLGQPSATVASSPSYSASRPVLILSPSFLGLVGLCQPDNDAHSDYGVVCDHLQSD